MSEVETKPRQRRRPADKSEPVVSHPPDPVQPADGLLTLIERMALNPEVPVDTLREMFLLKKEYEADEARKAYVADMVEFKKNPPELVKSSKVKYSGKGGQVNYSYVNLAEVYKATMSLLANHGFTHNFSKPWQVPEVRSPDGRSITLERVGMACVVTHKLGHSEEFAMEMPIDRTGGKNSSQEIGSTITYLQRYTFLAIVGLTAGDQDNDGNGSAWRPQDQGYDPDDYNPGEAFMLQGASTRARPQRQNARVPETPSDSELNQYRELLRELDGIDKFNYELEMLDNAKAPRIKREALWIVAKEKGMTFDTEARSFVMVSTPSEEVEQALDQAEDS